MLIAWSSHFNLVLGIVAAKELIIISKNSKQGFDGNFMRNMFDYETSFAIFITMVLTMMFLMAVTKLNPS